MKKSNLTVEDILNGNYSSIELINKEAIEKMKWGKYTDILYSFVGIFALGVYVFNRESKKYSVGKDNIIRVSGTKQWIYSRKYLKEHLSEFEEIKNILQPFAEVYTSIGNVYPIWPGGNEFKGKSHCYDIPDIFFQNKNLVHLEKFYVEKILNVDIGMVFIGDIVFSPYITNIHKIINEYSRKDYENFIKYIVETINHRSEKIESRIIKNE